MITNTVLELAVCTVADKPVAEEARRHKVDGVVCGHIHHAVMEDIEGIQYINTGDWVESCTAVVEHFDGTMELIKWTPAVETAPKPKLLQLAARGEKERAVEAA